MSKKYKLKDKLMPRRPSFLGLETSDWYELNAGNEVEIKKLPDLAKKYLEEVKSKSKEVN
jgi:hypothetical protein|tara:strand:- start:210 stop:389 length:180 start_codon:yes stop_codon:yes gene_type:complete